MRILAGLLVVLLAAPCFASEASKIRAGNRAYDKEKYGEAFELYQSAAQEPGQEAAKAQYNTGAALYRLKDYDNAVKAYKQAGEGDPNLLQSTHFNAGDAFYQTQSYDKAVDSFREAILMNPKDEAAIHNLQLSIAQRNEGQASNTSEEDKEKKNPDDKEDKESQESPQGDNGDKKPKDGKDKNNSGDGEQQQDQGEPSQSGDMSKDFSNKILQMANEEQNAGGQLGSIPSTDTVEKDW